MVFLVGGLGIELKSDRILDSSRFGIFPKTGEILKTADFVRGGAGGRLYGRGATRGADPASAGLSSPSGARMGRQKTTACLRRNRVSVAPARHHSLVICIEISNFREFRNRVLN